MGEGEHSTAEERKRSTATGKSCAGTTSSGDNSTSHGQKFHSFTDSAQALPSSLNAEPYAVRSFCLLLLFLLLCVSFPAELLSLERSKHEQSIVSYTGNDPLLPWLSYLSWTLQSYPSTSLPSHLLPLLEKLTRTFAQCPEYKNNSKYVQVWLMYADAVSKADDIYAYMSTNGIGERVAAYWVKWAEHAERQSLASSSKSSQAASILQKGLDMLAQPSSMLKQAQKRLKDREAIREKERLALAAEEAEAGLDVRSRVVQRAMFDEEGRKVLSRIERGTAGVQQAAFLTSMVTNATSTKSNVGIQIFSDENSTSSSKGNATIPSADGKGSDTGGVGWLHLPAQHVVDKENMRAATSWQQPLANSNSRAEIEPGVVKSDFEVFVEDDVLKASKKVTLHKSQRTHSIGLHLGRQDDYKDQDVAEDSESESGGRHDSRGSDETGRVQTHLCSVCVYMCLVLCNAGCIFSSCCAESCSCRSSEYSSFLKPQAIGRSFLNLCCHYSSKTQRGSSAENAEKAQRTDSSSHQSYYRTDNKSFTSK